MLLMLGISGCSTRYVDKPQIVYVPTKCDISKPQRLKAKTIKDIAIYAETLEIYINHCVKD